MRVSANTQIATIQPTLGLLGLGLLLLVLVLR